MFSKWLSRPLRPATPPPERIAPVDHTPMPRPRRIAAAPGEAFTPTQPKPGRREITGREEELERILQALHEERAHVVLYTERGRGKTTLANLVVETLRQGGVLAARHTCEASSSFDSVMRGLMRDLPHAVLATQAGDSTEPGCGAALPSGDLRPRDIVAVMSKLTCRSLVCVVDEFDRIEDADTRTRLADTIKQISDQAVPLLFMIVGVSENLEQILGQHPSIQRNLVPVPLPLLRDAEVGAILENGALQAGYALFQSATERVTAIARGSPYMAQLMGLRLIQAAARRESKSVTDADFKAAVARLLHEAPRSAIAVHAALTSNGADAEMARTLRVVASASQDVWGRFKAMPSFRDGVAVGQAHIKQERWSRLLEANVVQPAPGGFGYYSFTDRAFLHHVLLLNAAGPVDGVTRDSSPISLQMIASDQ